MKREAIARVIEEQPEEENPYEIGGQSNDSSDSSSATHEQDINSMTPIFDHSKEVAEDEQIQDSKLLSNEDSLSSSASITNPDYESIRMNRSEGDTPKSDSSSEDFSELKQS